MRQRLRELYKDKQDKAGTNRQEIAVTTSFAPLCAEHAPSQDGITLHAAACHACLFAPETSCERGNKYLDRSVLVPTVERDDLAFFAEVTDG